MMISTASSKSRSRSFDSPSPPPPPPALRTHRHQAAFEGQTRDALEEQHDLPDFGVGHEGALAAADLGGVEGDHHHVAEAEQELRLLVEHDATVHAARHLEGDAAGHVALDESGDHVGLRTLGHQDEVHADHLGLLGDADDRLLDLLVGHHGSASSSMTKTM